MKPRILIVDDEKLNLLTFEAFLAEDGYDLHCAEDGPTALALARSLLPDLVLLDVMMPEMDGYSVCRQIRAEPEIGHVPIIIVTALHDSAARLEGLRAGADDFLTKPCSRDEIRARVRTVVSLNRFRTMAEQRARFERLFEAAPAGILVTDATGAIVASNRLAAELVSGNAETPLVGSSLPRWFGSAATAALQDVIMAALAGATPPPREFRSGEGAAERICRVRATAVPDSGVQRAMLIFGDVTAEVRSREALEDMNRRLDELVCARTRQLEDANALLLSYASFVSHDLRSPLTVMKGYLSLLHEGVVPLAQAAPMIRAAYDATVMMQELVQNILQLAHDEHDGAGGEGLEPVELQPIVGRVWSHVSSLFPHAGRTFSTDGLPALAVNPLLAERVFYNLLTNAAKYSAERAAPVIEVGTIETPEGPAVFVRDNGVGFDSRDVDKLFREFSRLAEAPTGGGFGLGLSLVARLVRAHGGRMWAEGQLGAGATFYVQFGATTPVAAPPEPRAAVCG